MSADLFELFKAHKAAREDLELTTEALRHGVASRVEEASGILSECERTLMQAGWSDEALDLIELMADLNRLRLDLDGDGDGAAEGAESEVSDADD